MTYFVWSYRKRCRTFFWQSGSPMKMIGFTISFTKQRCREALFYNQILLDAEKQGGTSYPVTFPLKRA